MGKGKKRKRVADLVKYDGGAKQRTEQPSSEQPSSKPNPTEQNIIEGGGVEEQQVPMESNKEEENSEKNEEEDREESSSDDGRRSLGEESSSDESKEDEIAVENAPENAMTKTMGKGKKRKRVADLVKDVDDGGAKLRTEQPSSEQPSSEPNPTEQNIIEGGGVEERQVPNISLMKKRICRQKKDIRDFVFSNFHVHMFKFLQRQRDY
ncbi:protein DEK-like [Arabidopsis lyrata subsp. lyrata]|uniref:protein DEK-like n=1 Tax=Arabidopsis lyrata subsp. lyrata TaxID=81972 RepID=UPI000A29E57B|nr:protein DEK-like [Arabidopsis lyrata subsp. lyrata]|eukprot:XP_020871407.1 protein DEK-like [Arabidopsis lyrata subsp. lyrata]